MGTLPGAGSVGSVTGGLVSGVDLCASSPASAFGWSVSISDFPVLEIGGLSVWIVFNLFWNACECSLTSWAVSRSGISLSQHLGVHLGNL